MRWCLFRTILRDKKACLLRKRQRAKDERLKERSDKVPKTKEMDLETKDEKLKKRSTYQANLNNDSLLVEITFLIYPRNL